MLSSPTDEFAIENVDQESLAAGTCPEYLDSYAMPKIRVVIPGTISSLPGMQQVPCSAGQSAG